MLKEELIPLIREFPDRSIQWLLETPDNVRCILLIVASELAEKIDYSRLKRINKTFISDDLQKHEADMIFSAPFSDKAEDNPKEVIIYILIEHQSSVDPEMAFRVLSYMVGIWETQRREWISNNVPIHQRKFRPILPVVFYTGSRTWDSPLDMRQLMELPDSFEQFVYQPNILFLNLKATEPNKLVEHDHPFGWILRLLQKEDAKSEEFEDTLRLVANHLEQMPPEDRANWEKLMWFLLTLIYNRREREERSEFVKIVENNVSDRNRKEEIKNMGKTIAQELIEEGKQIGIELGKEIGKELGKEIGKELGKEIGKELGTITAKQDALIKLLKARFGIDSKALVEKIKSIKQVDQLDEFFDRAIVAVKLDDVGI
jgi:predicted transposase YdaD